MMDIVIIALVLANVSSFWVGWVLSERIGLWKNPEFRKMLEENTKSRDRFTEHLTVLRQMLEESKEK